MRKRHGARLYHAEIRADRLLMVIDGDAPLITAEQVRLAGEGPVACSPVEMIDRATWETLQRLAQTGILQLANTPTRVLYRAGGDVASQIGEPAARAA
jgi:hypothetical protein